MNIEQMLEHIRASEKMMKNITAWVELPAKEAVYADFPDFLDERITKALERRESDSCIRIRPALSGRCMTERALLW